jgi:RNA polymerase sigma-70 factor (ECF subfamily)
MQAEAPRPPDAELVARVLAGDPECYAVLVQRHSRALFALAFRITGNGHDADDVVQEAFLRAFRSLSRFEQRADFGTWIYRIALNCALHAKGRRRLEPAGGQVADPPPAEAPTQRAAPQEQSVYSAQVQKRVAAAMQALSRAERAAFVMRHLEGRSIQDIAVVFGCKPNAVKNTVFRAVQKLRQELATLVRTP